MNRRRIDALEKRFHEPGACPGCGGGEDDISTIEAKLYGEGEPLGYYYEMPPDKRRYPYPPDPRPVCPMCGRNNGPTLFLTAVYDKAEWDALQKRSPAGG